MTDMARKGRRNPARGVANGNSALSEEQAMDIIRLVQAGALQREAGSVYGVSQQTVSGIVNGHTWVHLQLEGT